MISLSDFPPLSGVFTTFLHLNFHAKNKFVKCSFSAKNTQKKFFIAVLEAISFLFFCWSSVLFWSGQKILSTSKWLNGDFLLWRKMRFVRPLGTYLFCYVKLLEKTRTIKCHSLKSTLTFGFVEKVEIGWQYSLKWMPNNQSFVALFQSLGVNPSLIVDEIFLIFCNCKFRKCTD